MYKDINLLPKSNSKISRKSLVTYTIIGGALFLVMSIFGIIIPLSQKIKLQSSINEAKDNIVFYGEYESEYTNLLTEYNYLTKQNEAIKSIKDNYIKTTELLEDLQRNVPGGIEFATMNYSTDFISINGHSTSYKEIAQYMVKLRSIDYISDIKINTITYDESMKVYNFDLSCAITKNNQTVGTDVEGGQ